MKNTWGVELNTLSWASDGSLEYIGLINSCAPVTKDIEKLIMILHTFGVVLLQNVHRQFLNCLAFGNEMIFCLWTPPLSRHLWFGMYSLTQTIIPNHCFYVPTTAMLIKRNRPVLYITIEERTWFELLISQYINHKYFITQLGKDMPRF